MIQFTYSPERLEVFPKHCMRTKMCVFSMLYTMGWTLILVNWFLQPRPTKPVSMQWVDFCCRHSLWNMVFHSPIPVPSCKWWMVNHVKNNEQCIDTFKWIYSIVQFFLWLLLSHWLPMFPFKPIFHWAWFPSDNCDSCALGNPLTRKMTRAMSTSRSLDVKKPLPCCAGHSHMGMGQYL